MSSLWIQKKYLNIAAQNLEQFKWKSENLANCRCPICTDSQKNKYKARFYIYEKKGNFLVMCHNCQYSTTFGNFLKSQNPNLYRQYVMERYKKPVIIDPIETLAKESAPIFESKIIDLPRISELSIKHIAYKYLSDRKISKEFYWDLYYAEDFKEFIDRLVPDHGKKLYSNDKRIVIPFYDLKKNLVGITGRSLDPKSDLRYIIINIDSSQSKIFGLDRLDKSKKTYVTEGPFDSMFLGNAIASAGSNLLEVVPYIDKSKTTFIFDNEPRNSAIISLMKKTIKAGYSIFIWPDSIKEKDINELILAQWTPSEVLAAIDSQTVSGLSAKFQLSQWSKI